MENRRRLRWFDGAIACALIAGTVALLGATADMGFTRDESFYFKYASTYQDWFSRVAKPPSPESQHSDPPLGRRDVVRTWSENFEHPPLLKVLFGWSWLHFADKRRKLSLAKEVSARGLTASEGFEVGEAVRLLGPMPVSGDRSDDARALGWAEVAGRETDRAVLRITDGNLVDITKACEDPGDAAGAAWITPCQAASSGSLQVLDESTAMRLPAWVMTGLLLALLYLFGAELFGRWAGLFAALAFLFVPRQFFHAHLCSFDIGVTTMIVATVYAFWKSLQSRVWAVLCGVIWGLALLTKLNAFFVPIPLLAAWLFGAGGLRWLPALTNRETLRRGALPGAAVLLTGVLLGVIPAICLLLLWLAATRRDLTIPAMPKAFLWMPPIGLLMLFGLWPRMWYDPAGAFHDYLNFHLSHVHYLQQYFGAILSVPPFPVTYPWVLTALTVPAPLLCLFAVGCVTLFAAERARTSLFDRVLIAANLLFPILLISLPNTPIFGGVKHWFVTMAFFALIAGYGFDWIRRRLAAKAVITIGLAAAMLASSVVASVGYARAGTSYYNVLAGGIRGAATHRMHRQFWGYAGRYGLEYVNENAPRNASVAFHNTTWDAVDWYKRDGMLRHDIRWRRDPSSGCKRDEIYLFHHQESFAQDQIDAWDKLRGRSPVRVISVDGVPILSIYRCERTKPSTQRSRNASRSADTSKERSTTSPDRVEVSIQDSAKSQPLTGSTRRSTSSPSMRATSTASDPASLRAASNVKPARMRMPADNVSLR